MIVKRLPLARRWRWRQTRSSALPVLGFAATLLMVIWLGTWGQLLSDRAAQQRDNAQEAANIALVFEQYVARSIGDVDRLLLYLREAMHLSGQTASWETLIAGRHTSDAQQLQIAVTDQSGTLIATSLRQGAELAVNLADREHVAVHLRSKRDALFISRPIMGRISRKWSVQVSRPYFQPDGSIGGVLIVSLDPAYLSRVYQGIDLGLGSGLALIGDDDVIRAGTGVFASYQGRGLRAELLNGEALPAHNGTQIVHSNAAGQSRIVGTRAVTGYPLSVIVSGGDLNVDSTLRQNRGAYLRGAAFLSLMVVLATIFTLRMRTQHDGQIARLVHLDSLTGLANRSSFRDTLSRAIAGAGEERSVALHLIDLDRFKQVNDTLGHPAGDALLKEVGLRLMKNLRSNDVAARFGGDEFAVVQTGVRDDADAAALATRLCDLLSEPYEIDGRRVEVGASIGISIAPRHAQSLKGMLASADLALYAAKADGGNIHRIYDTTLTAAIEQRRGLESDLRAAITQKELTVNYQPIIDRRTQAVIGYEALVRWTHPQRGVVSPAEFIPLAEETGLIMPLGAWVLTQACSDIAARGSHLKVSVNLSPVQFKKCDIVHLVRDVLAETGLAAHRLEIEITESTLMQKDGRTVGLLKDLRAMGVRVALDDFGTGFSSLSYLHMYPVNTIKIDRSFVMLLGQEESALSIIRAIIALANSLGMSTTAEGVETLDQFQQLCALGCDQVQGYYFGQPRPISETPHIAGPTVYGPPLITEVAA